MRQAVPGGIPSYRVVISSLIGVGWTTPITHFGQYGEQSSEGTNYADDVSEARGGLHATGRYQAQGRCMCHIRRVDTQCLSNFKLQSSTWYEAVEGFVLVVVYEET